MGGGGGVRCPPVLTRDARGAYEFRRAEQITLYYYHHCTYRTCAQRITAGEIVSLVYTATGCVPDGREEFRSVMIICARRNPIRATSILYIIFSVI